MILGNLGLLDTIFELRVCVLTEIKLKVNQAVYLINTIMKSLKQYEIKSLLYC